MPATRTKVWGQRGVAEGLLYRATIRGQWHYGSKPTQVADAVCRRGKDGTWRPAAQQVRVSGVWRWTPTIDDGNGCNTRTHSYVARFTPWASDGFAVSLPDSSPGNNSGALKVTLARVL